MLDKFRVELNQIDQEIIALLDRRFKITNQVGAYKKEKNMVILQPDRETEILNRIAEELKSSEHCEYIIAIYKAIFEESRRQQGKYLD